MVGKKKIEALDFKTIEEYFEYIVDSEVNGNLKQAKNLYEELSKKQKQDFLFFLESHLEWTFARAIELLNRLKP